MGVSRRLCIGVYIHTWHTFGRDMLQGVARFAGEHPELDFHLPRPGDVGGADPLPPEVDGLVVRIGAPADLPADFGMHLPRVVITNTVGTGLDADFDWDNRAIGRLAAEHLLDQGHRTLWFIGEREKLYHHHRAEGFALAAHARSAATHELWVGWNDRGALAQWMDRRRDRPIGVLAAADLLARDVLAAARRAGRHVPEDLAVIGAGDDGLLCAMTNPPLSSVALPGEQVGYEAAALLLARLLGEQPTPGSPDPAGPRDPQAPRTPRLVGPTHVAVRQSTDLLAIDDPLVARLLRLIRQRATQGLTLAEVRRAAALSRRALEVRFKRVVGRTLEQEVRRVRVNHAMRLLATTSLPMADVADRSGFSSAQRLSEVFARELGHSPTAYRRRTRGRVLKSEVERLKSEGPPRRR